MPPARRASANVDAPVWKSYVAARIDSGVGSTPTLKATALSRSRKRVKPTGSSADVGFMTNQHLATRASVRSYWEGLTVAERLQILMVDDPDIVKQLYKLNLSLLCVGLMQRHLKGGTTRTAAATTTSTTTSTTSTGTASVTSVPPQTKSVIDGNDTISTNDSERTYDLLEAMEFMDIGTGILTVKTELVEDVDHMFSLVTAVLHGFLITIHVLSETQFRELFVTESEVINTWEDYERLIAMLVEQLMLRSYVAYLEKQATEQMEALLLEASLEGKGVGSSGKTSVSQNSMDTSKKKKKKKKKTKAVTSIALAEKPNEPKDEVDQVETDAEDEPEEEVANDVVVDDFSCQSECSTEDADLSGPSSPVKSVSKALNRLNPHARAFEPSLLTGEDLRSPTSGKRKLDDFIIHIPWQDLFDDEDEGTQETPVEQLSDDLGCRRPREKQRRREEDAELEWHLQHIYASTSSIFGWDFNEQREIRPAPMNPWTDASLWRTGPHDVVRYYFPPTDHPSAFPGHPFVPPASLPPPPGGPPSRYYYAPNHASHMTPTSSSPRSNGVASVFPPFMPPPSGPPVSFWDETIAHLPSPPTMNHQPYPRFRPTNAPRRRKSATD